MSLLDRTRITKRRAGVVDRGRKLLRGVKAFEPSVPKPPPTNIPDHPSKRRLRRRRIPLPEASPIALGLSSSQEVKVYFELLKREISFQIRVRFFAPSATPGTAEVDFLLPDHRIALMVDGPFHASADVRARDFIQEQLLSARGFFVVRLNWKDIDRDMSGLLDRVIGTPVRPS